MVGLDAAGKTTILYKLKLGEGKIIRVSFSMQRYVRDNGPIKAHF